MFSNFLPRSLRKIAALTLTFTFAVSFAQHTFAEDKKTFRLAWSIYAGWMPWPYAQQAGIIKKWADKYGINIELQQVDYIESINQYTAGQFDACLMTNMDALTIPAAGGVDTTILIVGDYSNGNDGLTLKGKSKLADIKGQKVNLVELSVSHYFLARALDSVGLKERDVKVVNTSDADIVAAWKTADVTAAASWNPQLAEIKQQPDTHLVFDSSKIPGEILDAAAIKTDVLKQHPEFAKALVGAWFETLSTMSAGKEATAAKEAMAKLSGTDLPGYEAQLKTTRLFYTPNETVNFTENPDLIATMDMVRKFSFDHGLLGQNATSVDAVGIEFPGGKTLGNPKNIKLRFDSSVVKMAADGKL
ncbi:MAG TPA: putative urea ABC transporter substrate-binding protein [Pseudomonadales bacterium]|nr:putative urea ABC transporter substrate-binding protein [Pseudomonadales bacterium]